MDLSEEQIAELQEIFNLVDKDGGGSISNEELKDLMDTVGIKASQEDVDKMIKEIDQDSNGEVDFEEFVAVMSRKVNCDVSRDQVKTAFDSFTDTPGLITKAQLENILQTQCSKTLSEEQTKEILSKLNFDDDGNFLYNDYLERVMPSTA